jgi:sugar lactone lactonase YvrE
MPTDLLGALFAVFGTLLGAPDSTGTQPIALDPAAFPEQLRAAVDQIAPVYRQRPNDPSVLYQVAAVQARAGQVENALATLRRMAETGSGVDPRLRDGFQSLAENPEFLRIRARIQQENPPVHRARLAFDIRESGLAPEGVAWSERTRLLYFGSFGKVVAVGLDGLVRTSRSLGAKGLGAVAGIRVDDGRGELWATSSVFGAPDPKIVRGLFRFRLSNGELVAAYPLPGAEVGFLNDVAVTPEGVAYATATDTGALIRADPAAGNADTFLPAGTLPDPNGIAASEDGRYLFVAGWFGIVRVDLRTRATLVLKQPANVASGCLDGLYLAGAREIIAVQNCVHATGRIMRFMLSSSRDAIESAEVLESYNPLFDGITTAAIAGRTLYFVANTQFRKIGPDGKPTARLDPLHVLSLPLGD